MQYVLSEQEYADLTKKQATLAAAPKEAIAAMRQMLIGPKCVATSPFSRYSAERFTYCDQCPLSDIGRDGKRPSRELSKIMCDLPRDYSK